MDDRFFKGDKYKDSPADLGATKYTLKDLLLEYNRYLYYSGYNIYPAYKDTMLIGDLIDRFLERFADRIHTISLSE